MKLQALVTSLFIGCSLAGLARADVRWNLTTADFKTQAINLLSIDAQSVHFIDKQSAEQTLPLDRFVGLQGVAAGVHAPTSPFMLVLNTGAKISGDVASLKEEKLVFTGGLVGDLSFPLKQIVRIESVARAAAIKKTPPSKTEDTVQLANGDSVHGVVESMTNKAVTIKTDAGPSDVPLDSIAAVVFADSGAPPEAAGKGYRVQFDDGSNLSVTALTVQGSNTQLALPGGSTCTLDLGRLVSIEQIAGPVCWLSSLAPTENIQTPFLDVSWPARMNLSVTGEPIRVGAQIFAHGIGVHSKSRLSWAIGDGYKSFRTQYAVADDLPYADVDVRILLDGKVVHEAKGVKTHALSKVIAVDLNGAKTITLEVDFGAGYDVQDRVNWIEPALLRENLSAPATQPSMTPGFGPDGVFHCSGFACTLVDGHGA